jgi:hypothetical protein
MTANVSWRTHSGALGGAAIDDIISHGRDRQRGPWPRRVTAAAVVAAVLAVLIVERLPREAPPRSHHHKAAANHAFAVHGTIQLTRPDGITGPTDRWAAGLRLLVGGERPAWLWPATGRMTPIGGLPTARWDYMFTRVKGGWAIQSESAVGPQCVACAARPSPVYFLADSAGSATPVGVADRVAPAAEPGAVWLSSYPASIGPFNADPTSAVGFAQKVSATGKLLGPRIRLPAGYVIDQATVRGLLLVPAVARGAPVVYKLWNPALGRVSRQFGAVIATSDSRIAWTSGCEPRCAVQVLDVATSRRTRIVLPAGSTTVRGSFSPDARLLALAVTFGDGGNGGARAIRLEVASVPGGRLSVVPGTWASSDALTGFGWPSAGDSLVAELSFVTKVQVASWHPGARRLAVVVVRPEQRPNDLVVG